MVDVVFCIVYSAASNLAVDSAPGKQHGYPQPGVYFGSGAASG